MATTPTAPRACLLSIPPELKAHIVQLAAWQDDVAADRRNSDRDLPSSPVGSLVALSLVNKEFNDLTAVHLFEVSWALETGRTREELKRRGLRRLSTPVDLPAP